MLFQLLVFLHITAMFAAVALTYGPETILLLAIRSNSASWLHATTTAIAPLARFVPVLYGVAGIFGLAAAYVGGHPLLATWLVIAYAIFIILTAIGITMTGPNLRRLGASVAGITDGPLPPDAVAVARSASFRIAAFLDFFLLAVIILDMVVRPA